MTQPPIVPGTPEPPYQPEPQYQPQPPQIVYVQQPAQPGSTAGKAALSTVVVIATLVGLFCVLPALMCGIFGAIGSAGR